MYVVNSSDSRRREISTTLRITEGEDACRARVPAPMTTEEYRSATAGGANTNLFKDSPEWSALMSPAGVPVKQRSSDSRSMCDDRSCVERRASHVGAHHVNASIFLNRGGACDMDIKRPFGGRATRTGSR